MAVLIVSVVAMTATDSSGGMTGLALPCLHEPLDLRGLILRLR